MGVVRGLEKRKACDLCHIKKIRCDAKRPTCSHCVVYGSQCAYTPHIKRRRNEVKIETNVRVKPAAPISEDQVARPEPTPPPPPPGRLPPQADLLPIIHDYFANLNSTIPLFDPATFTRLLNEASAHTSTPLAPTPLAPTPPLTAAVNVTLALTFIHRATTYPPIPGFDPESCIANAQSAAGSLAAAGDSDSGLLGLQVLLGLAMLHLGTPHESMNAAKSLVANAVKLAHKLGLHQARTNALFDEQTALQRVRVFWIVYVLDKDLSTRTSEPPLIREEDFDVVVPESVEGAGRVRFATAVGAEVEFDVFHAWIRLARVQGCVYKRLFSARAEGLPLAVRHANRKYIHEVLLAWMATVPGELRAGLRIKGAVLPGAAARQLVALCFSCMFCFMQTHRVGSHDAEWIMRLVDYSQRAIEGADLAEPEPVAGDPLWLYMEPSSGWLDVVGAARDCARLFRVVDSMDTWLTWSVTCIYMSSTLVLISNMLTVPELERETDAEGDEQLVTEALAFLSHAATAMPDWEMPRKLHAAFEVLSCRARVARAKFALGRPSPGPLPASVAWFQEAARRSAGLSALAIVETFTRAEVKPLATKLWGLQQVLGSKKSAG